MTEPKITLIKLSEFGYEKENNLFLSSPKKGKLKPPFPITQDYNLTRQKDWNLDIYPKKIFVYKSNTGKSHTKKAYS